MKLLVPLDGSAFGEHALPHAASLARRSGSRLQLAHVYVPPMEIISADIHLPTSSDEDAQAREQAKAYLAEVAERVRAVSPSLEVETILLEGPVTDSLFEHIRATAPDLIVLTTHGRGRLSRFWLGSVTTELLHRSATPMLLVRPKDGAPDLGADFAPRRILIPLDGSRFSEQILPLATAVGEQAGAKFRLVRVVPPMLSSGSGRGLGTIGAGIETADDNLHFEAGEQLAKLAANTPGLNGAETHVISDWPPASAILADAEANAIDMIALETHGRSGLKRMLLGSVADKIVRGSSHPVLLHRPET